MRRFGMGSTLAGLASLLGLAVGGCAGSRVAALPMLQEFQRYERDVQSLAPTSPGTDFLRAGQDNRDKARPLAEKGKNSAAWPLLMEAVADGRAALAAAQAEKAAAEADACLRAARGARKKWEQAMRMLVETEQVARRTAEGAFHETPSGEDLSIPDLPASTYTGYGPPLGTADELSSLWRSWLGAAAGHKIGTADLETRFDAYVGAAAVDSKKDRALDLYLAGRTLQELEGRVRAQANGEVCPRAAEMTSTFSEAADRVLHATLDLQKGLKDDLRAQLERLRDEADDRQRQLSEALRAIEGKFARISHDARGTIVSLSDILFDFDKATLKREVEFHLVRVATILNQFPEMQIAVEGHTDNVGKPEYNLELSKRRAQAVHDFLATQGVDPGRMTVQGFGMSRPVATNDTEEGRQKNRRVDLVIPDQK